MNGRESSPAGLIATGALSLGMLFPLGAVPSVQQHVVALVQTIAPPPHSVRFTRDGDPYSLTTSAVTVGDLLRERGIEISPNDALTPSVDTPLADNLSIEYRAAIPVTLVVGGQRRDVQSAAPTVAELLAQQSVALGAHDRVLPGLHAAVQPATVIRVLRVKQWTERISERIAPAIEHRLDIDLGNSDSRVVAAGAPGVRERLVQFTRIDDRATSEKSTLDTRVVSSGKVRIVAHGILDYSRYARFAKRGVQGSLRIAGAALNMLATAYTANCYGCSGIAATGVRAGHGIVAVDPSFIRLGTKLFIPGYGHAVAGDTGGSIRGNRIDLGFESNGDALRFGRRSIVVYVLK